MERFTSAGVLLTAFLYASVVIVEPADSNARPVFVANVVDGDTVELADGRRVRLVGYNAYELSEPPGALARRELRSLCLGEAYLDVTARQIRPRVGLLVVPPRWKHHVVRRRPEALHSRRRAQICEATSLHPSRRASLHPVDDSTHHQVRQSRRDLRVQRRSPHKIYGGAVVLTSGVYEVYCGGQLAARLRLMSRTPDTTIINLPTANAIAGTAPASTTTVATTVTVTQTVTRTVTVTTTVAQTRTTTLILPTTVTTTATKTATVEKPYVHSITYVAIAVVVAMMTLAAYLAKRSRPVA